MSPDRRHLVRLETMLARLLRYGAIAASILLAVGMAMGMTGPHISRAANLFMTIGIVVLIALPVVRVGLATAVFLFERDYLFAFISGLVLFIITIGFLLGTIGQDNRLH
jgi:uncharacterized membrane protein